jgi:hypothetical protein
MDATIGQAFGQHLPGRVRPDTVHSTRHAMVNRKRRGQGTDDGTEGVRTSSIATTTRRRTGTRRLGDGNAASATATTAATRRLLGVALPPKRRLGALLSSDDSG